MKVFEHNMIIIDTDDTLKLKQEDISIFSSYELFVATQIMPASFYITTNYFIQNEELEIIDQIRKSKYWYLPIFTEFENDNPILDTQETIVTAYKKSIQSHKLLKKANINTDVSGKEDKLLLFLYLRENKHLIPYFDTKSPILYKYPILKYIEEDEYEVEWLSDLVSRKLISFVELKDRVRLCEECDSAHVYFKDICPQCKSIKIENSRILHCFSCGEIDREYVFQTDDGLVCQKCRSHLRLIGVDYDLPASQYSCSSCHHIFVEPEVVAKCTNCMHTNEPDNLKIFEIYILKLTSSGKRYLLSENNKMVFSLSSKNLQFIKVHEFKLFLNWMIAIYARDAHLDFAILLIKIKNIDALVGHHGFMAANSLIDTLSTELLKMIRDTDMLTIDEANKIWILLPVTNKKGIEARIAQIIDMQNRTLKIDIDASVKVIYTVDEEYYNGVNADELMENLIND